MKKTCLNEKSYKNAADYRKYLLKEVQYFLKNYQLNITHILEILFITQEISHFSDAKRKFQTVVRLNVTSL